MIDEGDEEDVVVGPDPVVEVEVEAAVARTLSTVVGWPVRWAMVGLWKGEWGITCVMCPQGGSGRRLGNKQTQLQWEVGNRVGGKEGNVAIARLCLPPTSLPFLSRSLSRSMCMLLRECCCVVRFVWCQRSSGVEERGAELRRTE